MTELVVFRTREMQRIEARLGRPIDAILRELYIERGMTLAEVGTELGLTKGAVSRWLERMGIEARRQGPRPESAA